MQKILIFLLLYYVPLIAVSQDVSFKGFVVEEGNYKAIPEAVVAVYGTRLTAKTDGQGVFIFDEPLPSGHQTLEVIKLGYKTKYVTVIVVDGEKPMTNRIQLILTSQEKKRRRTADKIVKKNERRFAKEREKEAKLAEKENKKNRKRETKERKAKEREDEKRERAETPVFDGDETSEPVGGTDTIVISPLQLKYAEILEVPPEEITNTTLYEFIDDWMGTVYVWGGDSKAGIDCSAFTIRLYGQVYGGHLERQAHTQYKSANTVKFKKKRNLEEGDLMFFRGKGEDRNKVVHVGIYLVNNKFVNATTGPGTGSGTGVKISDLSSPYWTNIFVAGGKRIKEK